MVPKLVVNTTLVVLLAAGPLIGSGPVAIADIDAKTSSTSGHDGDRTASDTKPADPSAGGDHPGSPSTTPLTSPFGSSHPESASVSASPTSTLGAGREPGDPPAGLTAREKDDAPSSVLSAQSNVTEGAATGETGPTSAPDTSNPEVPLTNTPEPLLVEAAETQPSNTPEPPPPFTDPSEPPFTDPPAPPFSDPPQGGSDPGTYESGESDTPASSSAAADTTGSVSDTVATPVAAVAPEVSTTVDASPSASIGQSVTATVEGTSAATAEPAADPQPVPAASPAPVSDVPVENTAAMVEAATAPTTTTCASADGCVTVLQVMLTSVASAIIAPLTQISSWFGSGWYQTDPAGVPRRPDGWSATGQKAVPNLASLLMPAGFQGALRQSTVDGRATSSKVGETILGQITVLDQGTQTGLTSPPAPEQPYTPLSVSVPKEVTKFVRHAIDELASSPSLAALALSALPGIGGLIIITAAGIRIGYRQAKFGLAVRGSGLARFVRSGPIGVVRSGSMVSVGPTKQAPRHRRPARHLHLVEDAA